MSHDTSGHHLTSWRLGYPFWLPPLHSPCRPPCQEDLLSASPSRTGQLNEKFSNPRRSTRPKVKQGRRFKRPSSVTYGSSSDVVSAAFISARQLDLAEPGALYPTFFIEGLVHFLDSKQRGRTGADQSAGPYGRHQASRRDVVGQIHDHHDVIFAKTVIRALKFSADSLDAGLLRQFCGRRPCP
jgi:hypothetical protein